MVMPSTLAAHSVNRRDIRGRSARWYRFGLELCGMFRTTLVGNRGTGSSSRGIKYVSAIEAAHLFREALGLIRK